jgi:hypothetical protein
MDGESRHLRLGLASAVVFALGSVPKRQQREVKNK